jgi:hypothetical protein
LASRAFQATRTTDTAVAFCFAEDAAASCVRLELASETVADLH